MLPEQSIVVRKWLLFVLQIVYNQSVLVITKFDARSTIPYARACTLASTLVHTLKPRHHVGPSSFQC